MISFELSMVLFIPLFCVLKRGVLECKTPRFATRCISVCYVMGLGDGFLT